MRFRELVRIINTPLHDLSPLRENQSVVEDLSFRSMYRTVAPSRIPKLRKPLDLVASNQKRSHWQKVAEPQGR